MDFFDQMAASGAAPEEAEVKTDLSGMEKGAALKKLDAVVQFCRKSSAVSLFVSFDPARPGGGETLFQPVARYFRTEKAHGRIERAQPLMSPESAGIFVRFRL